MGQIVSPFVLLLIFHCLGIYSFNGSQLPLWTQHNQGRQRLTGTKMNVEHHQQSNWGDQVILREEKNAFDEGEEINDRRIFLASLLSTGIILSLPGTASATTLSVENKISISNANTDIPSFLNANAAATAAVTTSSSNQSVDWNAILKKASKRALGGGKAGASAAVVQVLSLMWLRTSMNYQYRYGGNLLSSLQTLWDEGGIQRLYQGLPFAIVQGPLTRFGDTAANVGILALLESTPETQALPLPIKTVIGSIAAGSWRILLMPIDAAKTAMQVEGIEGLSTLRELTQKEGPTPLYQGALASAAATAVGHFPWYTTYNYLNEQFVLPVSAQDDLFLTLARSAIIGFTASCVSDVCSNSLRVIKTTKQTAQLSLDDTNRTKPDSTDNDSNDDKEQQQQQLSSSLSSKDTLSYTEVVKLILETDGVMGLFGRGLQTRLLTNSIQGAVFSVLWKYFQQTNGVV